MDLLLHAHGHQTSTASAGLHQHGAAPELHDEARLAQLLRLLTKVVEVVWTQGGGSPLPTAAYFLR